MPRLMNDLAIDLRLSDIRRNVNRLPRAVMEGQDGMLGIPAREVLHLLDDPDCDCTTHTERRAVAKAKR